MLRGLFGTCSVHKAPLVEEEVPVRYGLIRLPPLYQEAKRRRFPNAFSFVLGGCLVSPTNPRILKVHCCSQCREAERAWQKDLLDARKAYLAFQWAESTAERRLEDEEAYDMLKEQGIPKGHGDLGELENYELPDFPTWTRHLRNARASLREQKYKRRGGRAKGKSIVRAYQIERLKHADP